jgi:cadmium resistance protein CadD (predicted permease)
MTPSIFIARILGPVLLIIGIGLLLEGDAFRAMAGEFVRDQGLIYITGILTLAAGLAILNVHHLWTRDWRVLITIFGWLFLVGGIMRILAMSMAQRVGESVIAHQRWPLAGAIVTLALGAFVWDGGRRRPSHRVSAARSSSPASRSAKRPRRKAGETRSG